MRKLFIAIVLFVLLIPSAFAVGDAVELSGYMYGSLSQTADMIGGLEWDGDWVYANDIEQAYLNDTLILAGNRNDEIKLIAINGQTRYSLFGIQAGMDVSMLQPFFNMYEHKSVVNGDGTNHIITLSEQYDGYVEILWVVEVNGRLTDIIYEVGYGHGID